ncbi:MAG: TIGR00730 family Rossman fold protein [Pseudomonadota bacterium]
MTQNFSVCLYCGSRNGSDPEFANAAETFGRELARRGHRLVYGAGDVGLMGIAARAAQDAGGPVTGIIPQHLVDMEVGKADLDEYIVTPDMHVRKKAMFDKADAVVALPGGPGTLDELIEVLTWRQLGLHTKPLVVLNTSGYWNPLLALLRHTVDHGFADRSVLGFLTIAATPEGALDRIEDLLRIE